MNKKIVTGILTFAVAVAVAVGVVWYRGGSSQFLVVEKKTEVSEQTQLGVDANARHYTVKLNGKSFDLVGPSAVKDIQRALGETQEKFAQTISRAKELSSVGDLNEENLGDYVAKVTPLVTADTANGQRISEEESKNFVDLLEAISLIRGFEDAKTFDGFISRVADGGKDAITQKSLDGFSSVCPSQAQNFAFVEALRTAIGG
ncbi:hypothetical protein ACFPGO_07795 [Arcanobacterium canis]|uniref:Uncharacterized protein n=1 Tax=Arcanobacterium canis TaxID=999183 RepID=A0ABY8FXV0_9ACTO|nr:hypothetical protein [Arcanobacterium canis]WFM83335.1 hypothetical protein P7079_08100 [Arcanobacterium canis]